MHSDQDIIVLLQDSANHERAFRLIVSSYKERLYHVIRKILIDHDDTDDVLQDTFIKIWKNLDKFRGDANLYTWLYRIGTNEALSFLRKRKKTQNISMDENPELMAMLDSSSKSQHMTGDEISLRLQKAILQLPEKQRLVFNMKYFDKLKYEEIAEITETSVGGLKANYHMAVKKIEEYLTEQ
jgi:RNA polymerase sigma-70 factor, ECF subfamily